jgi:hypothetical protein
MAKIEEVKEDDSPANKSEETASKPEPVVVVKDEHPVFKVIKNSNSEDVIESVRNFFEVDGVSVETLDGSGMTPLMHSCWKGNVAFVKFLIKQVLQKKCLQYWRSIIKKIVAEAGGHATKGLSSLYL